MKLENFKAKIVYFGLACLTVFNSCKAEFDIDEPSKGEADFSTMIVIGGNFSSGFKDGALSKEGQKGSFPVLLADRFKEFGNLNNFNVPYLKGEKGVFPDYDLNTTTPYTFTLPRLVLKNEADCRGNVSIAPKRMEERGDNEINLDDNSQRIFDANNRFHHFGIPAMKSFHIIFSAYGSLFNYTQNSPFSPFFWRFAESVNNSRIFDDALKTNPTFAIIDLGLADVLSYAIEGGIGNVGGINSNAITPPIQFEFSIRNLLDSLAARNVKGILLNIPDVTDFPYFNTIKPDAMNLEAAKAADLNTFYAAEGISFTTGDNFFVVKNEDGTFRKINSNEKVTLKTPPDSLRCADWGAFKPLTDEYYLSEAELTSIRTNIEGFNNILAQLAADYNYPVVDLHTFMKKVNNTITTNGMDISSTFVSGNFFSLDGLHPSDRGQAMIANECLKVINKSYKSSFPQYNIVDFKGNLFP
jgi:hypothetical protein